LPSPTPPCERMPNSLCIEKCFDDVWNGRRFEMIDELLSSDCHLEVEGLDTPISRDQFRVYQAAMLRAIPDLRAEILAITTEGEVSILAWRMRGTHLGPGLGIPATGRRVDFSGFTLLRFEHGVVMACTDRWNRGEVLANLMEVRVEELDQHTRLTKRESQVALLMAERLTHGEIALRIGISPNTARRHCERVLRKLGVRRRQEVARALGKIPGSVLNRHGSDFGP